MTTLVKKLLGAALLFLVMAAPVLACSATDAACVLRCITSC